MLRLVSKLILVLVTTFSLPSCKKDSNKNSTNEAFYIKAKLNNQEIRYTIDANGRIENKQISGSAFNSAVNNFPSFSFDIEANAPIQPGVYKESTVVLIFRYSMSATETFHSQMGNETDFEITITEITSNTIKGFFSGTIRKATNINEVYTVENGEFALRRS
jgi:hypothetical protein